MPATFHKLRLKNSNRSVDLVMPAITDTLVLCPAAVLIHLYLSMTHHNIIFMIIFHTTGKEINHTHKHQKQVNNKRMVTR